MSALEGLVRAIGKDIGTLLSQQFVSSAGVDAGRDWDTLEDNRLHRVTEHLTGEQAELVHAPGGGRWVVITPRILPGAKVQIAWPWTLVHRPRQWYRAWTGTGWTAWIDMTPDVSADISALSGRVGTLEAAPQGGSNQPVSGLKQVGLPLSVGHAGSEAATSGTVRVGFDWLAPSIPVTRLKVRLKNVNIRDGATRSGQVSLGGIWLGDVDASGNFSAPPVRISGPVDFDGADGYTSLWVDVPGGSLAGKAISYEYTSTGPVWAQLGTVWRSTDLVGASVGDAGMQVAYATAFTVDAIVETYATTPVVAVFGDSNSVGVGARALSQAWGVKAARKLGAIPQLYGSSGDTLRGSTDTTAFKWRRFAGCTPADAVLMALGQNDAAGTQPLDTLRAAADVVVPAMRTLGSRVYTVALMPRTTDSHADFEARRRAITDWYEAQPWGVHGHIDFTAAMTADDETMLPDAASSDGIHLSDAGTTAVADYLTEHYRITAPPVLYAA